MQDVDIDAFMTLHRHLRRAVMRNDDTVMGRSIRVDHYDDHGITIVMLTGDEWCCYRAYNKGVFDGPAWVSGDRNAFHRDAVLFALVDDTT